MNQQQSYPQMCFEQLKNITQDALVRKKTIDIYNDYNLESIILGKGAYGEVKKAFHKRTNLERAVKIIKKDNQIKAQTLLLAQEINILKNLDHPNIMKVYEMYEDSYNFYIVTELCNGGQLYKKVEEEQYLEEDTASSLFNQILQGVYYLHNHNIVHRDLKLENILFETDDSDSFIKIIDFGTSRIFKNQKGECEKLYSKKGTPMYISPEVLKQNYNEKCDLWSCGIILYIMLCGVPPFKGQTRNEIYQNILKGEYQFFKPFWNFISHEAKDLISKLLEYDVEKRISAKEALHHKWFIYYGKELTKTKIRQQMAANALKNMKNFRKTPSKLVHAIIIYIVSNLISSDEKKQLLQAFKALDKDEDGIISQEELCQAYCDIMQISQEKAFKRVNKIMEEVDINHSGKIDYSEFILATINKKKFFSKQRLTQAFQLFDEDLSGKISVKELNQIFKQLEIKDKEWRVLIEEFDQNQDGEISFEEFINMMTKYI